MLKANAFLERYRPARLDEVVGNTDGKRMLYRWLTSMGVPRCVLFCGDSGSGKTAMARILAAGAICTHRIQSNPDACGQVSCTCSRLLRSYFLFGRGIVCRNSALISVEDVKEDFKELLYAEPDAPMVFFYDEMHRAPKKVRDMLLTVVEEYQDYYNFVLMASTCHIGELEPAFHNRFVRVNTQLPSETEMLTLLRSVCTKESLPFDDQALLRICRDECCVPRNCLVTLWERASKL